MRGPGRPRGPRARVSAPLPPVPPVAAPPLAWLPGWGRGSQSRSLPLKKGSQRKTVGLLFPETQWGPCGGCGLLEERWDQALLHTAHGLPSRASQDRWDFRVGQEKGCHKHSRSSVASWALSVYFTTGGRAFGMKMEIATVLAPEKVLLRQASRINL